MSRPYKDHPIAWRTKTHSIKYNYQHDLWIVTELESNKFFAISSTYEKMAARYPNQQ